MAYDDATILPQHVSPPGYSSCGTGTHTVSSEPRDGIVERLIAQDPMIIAASSSGVMHTANTAQVATKSMDSPTMIAISRGRPDRRRSITPAARRNAIAASNCGCRRSPDFRRFRSRDRPFESPGQWQIAPSTDESQSEEVHLPYRHRTWTLKAGDEMATPWGVIWRVR